MKPTKRWMVHRRDAKQNGSHLWGIQWGYRRAGGRRGMTAWLPGGLTITYQSRR